MGTLVRVTVYTPDERAANHAFRAAFDRIRALDAILSDYRPDSELNQITRTAGRAVPVSKDLFAVLARSQELAEATAGAFDITQGPVIRLWRDARKTGRVPDRAALQDAAGRSGFRKLRLDAAHRTVTLDMAGMALDVGAIGKGYAASEAIEVLGGLGVRSALVAVSGDLAFSDAPPGQRGWRIGVHSGDPSIVSVPGSAGVDQRGSLDVGQQRAAPGRRRPPLLSHHRSVFRDGARRRHHRHGHRTARPRRRRSRHRRQRARRRPRAGSHRVLSRRRRARDSTHAPPARRSGRPRGFWNLWRDSLCGDRHGTAAAPPFVPSLSERERPDGGRMVYMYTS